MRVVLGLAVAALLAISAKAAVSDESFKDASGARVLKESIVVDADAAAVWSAFATDAGFEKWAAPWAHIVPGNGGTIEFGFAPNGTPGAANNVRHRIAVWLPNRMLVFANEYLPPGPGPFDGAAFRETRTILTFEDAGMGKTKVTETVVGFGSTPAHDNLYTHLHDGNAQYLTLLAKSFQKTN
ncbi:MAG: SRPBCC domain-containing protein [Alphaproteobacteria bacterium]|nr:SRPBCC domain-containing protein [Alphaproteobacteria bacterium]